jgi:hypothetical protein
MSFFSLFALLFSSVDDDGYMQRVCLSGGFVLFVPDTPKREAFQGFVM